MAKAELTFSSITKVPVGTLKPGTIVVYSGQYFMVAGDGPKTSSIFAFNLSNGNYLGSQFTEVEILPVGSFITLTQEASK